MQIFHFHIYFFVVSIFCFSNNVFASDDQNVYTNALKVGKNVISNVRDFTAHPVIAMLIGIALKETAEYVLREYFLVSSEQKEMKFIDHVMHTDSKITDLEKESILLNSKYGTLINSCNEQTELASDSESKKYWLVIKKNYEREYENRQILAIKRQQNALKMQNNFAIHLIEKEINTLEVALKKEQGPQQKELIQDLILQKQREIQTLIMNKF